MKRHETTLSAISHMEAFIERKEIEQMYCEPYGEKYINIQRIINKTKLRLEKAKRINRVDNKIKRGA